MNLNAEIKVKARGGCRVDSIGLMRHLTPLGTMLLGVAEGRLCLCDFADCRKHEAVMRALKRATGACFVEEETPVGRYAATELDRYFAGELHCFSVPVSLYCCDFSARVLTALARVAYGTTLSYGALAGIVGHKGAARAVANVVAANPIAVFLPCHRVVPAGGGVGRYRGGTEAKRLLLDLEKKCAINPIK